MPPKLGESLLGFQHRLKSVNGERFVSAESPERIMEKLEVVGKREEISVKWKKDWLIEMEGQNSNLRVRIEMYRLTENLVVMEVKKKGGDGESSNGIWSTKILPEIYSLVYRPQIQAGGSVST